MDKYEVFDGEEWSALYINGKLDITGDSYVIYERIADLLGVIHREGDFFMGGNHENDVALTVVEIESYEAGRQNRLESAMKLRHQAEELLRKAQMLEN